MRAPMASSRSVPRRLALVALSALAGLVLVEIGFRIYARTAGLDLAGLALYRRYVLTGRGNIDGHPYTLYVPAPLDDPDDVEGWFDQPLPVERTPGVTRVACLGASTTQRGYPELMEPILERETGRAFEVQNWGVSGWNTAETLINWVLHAQDWRPDVVVIHHAWNDIYARQTPGFRSDYSHYRRPWSSQVKGPLVRALARVSEAFSYWLMTARRFDVEAIVSRPEVDHLHPEPLVPETARAFERNLRTLGELAALRGARVVLVTMPWYPSPIPPEQLPPHVRNLGEGLLEHNRILRELAADEGWVLLDMAGLSEQEPERMRATMVPGDPIHWRPELMGDKAAWIAEHLIASGALDGGG